MFIIIFKIAIKHLPKTCKCYQKIYAFPGQTISKFFENEKLCYLKSSNVTTLNYLNSAQKDCKEYNRCQGYFCKPNMNEPCPVVDVYFNNIFADNSTGSTLYLYDNVSL